MAEVNVDLGQLLVLLAQAQQQKQQPQPFIPVPFTPTPTTEFLPRVAAGAVGGTLGAIPGALSLVTGVVGENPVSEFFGSLSRAAHEKTSEFFGVTEPPDTIGDHIANFIGTIGGMLVPMAGAAKIARVPALANELNQLAVKAPFAARSITSLLEGFAMASSLEDPTWKDVAFQVAIDSVLRSYRVAAALQPGKEKIPIWMPGLSRWMRASDLRGAEAGVASLVFSSKAAEATYTEALSSQAFQDLVARGIAASGKGLEQLFDASSSIPYVSLRLPANRGFRTVQLDTPSALAQVIADLRDGAIVERLGGKRADEFVKFFLVEPPSVVRTIVENAKEDKGIGIEFMRLFDKSGNLIPEAERQVQRIQLNLVNHSFIESFRSGKLRIVGAYVPQGATQELKNRLLETLTTKLYGPRLLVNVSERDLKVPMWLDMTAKESYVRAFVEETGERLTVKVSELEKLPQEGVRIVSIELSPNDFYNHANRARVASELSKRHSQMVEVVRPEAPKPEPEPVTPQVPAPPTPKPVTPEGPAEPVTPQAPVAPEEHISNVATKTMDALKASGRAKFEFGDLLRELNIVPQKLRAGVFKIVFEDTPSPALANGTTIVLPSSGNITLDHIRHELAHLALANMSEASARELAGAIATGDKKSLLQVLALADSDVARLLTKADGDTKTVERVTRFLKHWMDQNDAVRSSLRKLLDQDAGAAPISDVDAAKIINEALDALSGGKRLALGKELGIGIRIGSKTHRFTGLVFTEREATDPDAFFKNVDKALKGVPEAAKEKTQELVAEVGEFALELSKTTGGGPYLAITRTSKQDDLTALISGFVRRLGGEAEQVSSAITKKAKPGEFIEETIEAGPNKVKIGLVYQVGQDGKTAELVAAAVPRLHFMATALFRAENFDVILAQRVAEYFLAYTDEFTGRGFRIVGDPDIPGLVKQVLAAPGQSPTTIREFFDSASIHAIFGTPFDPYAGLDTATKAKIDKALAEDAGVLHVVDRSKPDAPAVYKKKESVSAVVVVDPEKKGTSWELRAGDHTIVVHTDSLFAPGEASTLPREVRVLAEMGWRPVRVLTSDTGGHTPEALLTHFETAVTKNVTRMDPSLVAKHPVGFTLLQAKAADAGYILSPKLVDGKFVLFDAKTGEPALYFENGTELVRSIMEMPAKVGGIYKQFLSLVQGIDLKAMTPELSEALERVRQAALPPATPPSVAGPIGALQYAKSMGRKVFPALATILSRGLFVPRIASEFLGSYFKRYNWTRELELLKLPGEVLERLNPFKVYYNLTRAVAKSYNLTTEELMEPLELINRVAPTTEEKKLITMAMLNFVGKPDSELTAAELGHKMAFLAANKDRWKPEYEQLIKDLAARYKAMYEELASGYNPELPELFAYVTKLYDVRPQRGGIVLVEDPSKISPEARKALQEFERELPRFFNAEELMPIDKVFTRYVAEKNYLLHVKPLVESAYDAAETMNKVAALAETKEKGFVAANIASFIKGQADAASGRTFNETLATAAISAVMEEAGVHSASVVKFLNMFHSYLYMNTLGFRPASGVRNMLSQLLLVLPAVGSKHYSRGIEMWSRFLAKDPELAKHAHTFYMEFLPENDTKKVFLIRMLRRAEPGKYQKLVESLTEKSMVFMRLSEQHTRGMTYFAGVSAGQEILAQLKRNGYKSLNDELRKQLTKKTVLAFFGPNHREELFRVLDEALKTGNDMRFLQELGRELVGATLWRYGPLETPQWLRSPAMRLLSMYSIWPSNFFGYATNLIAGSATNPYLRRSLATYLGLQFVAAEAFAALGLYSPQMFWTGPLEYSGGPLLEMLADAYDVSRFEGAERRAAITRFQRGVVQGMAPLGGAIRDLGRQLHMLFRGDYEDSFRLFVSIPKHLVGKEGRPKKEVLKRELGLLGEAIW